MTQKKFTIPCTPNITTKDNPDGSDGSDELIITGIANTGLEDLVGDIVTTEALNRIAEQIPLHNLHLDHDRELGGVLGPLLEGWVTDDGVLHYKARIINEHRDMIRSLLEQGVHLGSSIAGVCEYEDNSDKNIVTWDLTEISLTPIPCDQGTMATVRVAKSFRDAVELVKELSTVGSSDLIEGGNDMTDEVQVTEEKVVELINTAVNELREDLTQSIIEEVSKDYEAKLAELKAELDDIRGQLDSAGEDEAEGDVPEGEATGEAGEGEAKATTDDDDEDESGDGETKPDDEEDDEEEDKAGEDEEDEDEEGKPADDEEDDEEEKNLTDLVLKMVQEETQKQLKEIFHAPTNPSFQYTNEEKGLKESEENTQTKTKYTTEEIANILTGNTI